MTALSIRECRNSTKAQCCLTRSFCIAACISGRVEARAGVLGSRPDISMNEALTHGWSLCILPGSCNRIRLQSSYDVADFRLSSRPQRRRLFVVAAHVASVRLSFSLELTSHCQVCLRATRPPICLAGSIRRSHDVLKANALHL